MIDVNILYGSEERIILISLPIVSEDSESYGQTRIDRKTVQTEYLFVDNLYAQLE